MQIRIFVVLFFCLLAVIPASGQKVLVYEDLQGDTITPDTGMNRKHYRHPFIGFAMFLGGADGPTGAIKSTNSWVFDYGVRYKRKFTHFLSGGAEWNYRRLTYTPAGWEIPGLAGESELTSEKLMLVQTGLGLYQRINWQKRRGNFIGRFIDIGVYGNWNLASRHVYSFKQTTGERVKVKESGLNYVRPFDYGVLARIGFGNFVLKSTYRFSDHFSESSGLAEFPRFTLGFELGMHPF